MTEAYNINIITIDTRIKLYIFEYFKIDLQSYSGNSVLINIVQQLLFMLPRIKSKKKKTFSILRKRNSATKYSHTNRSFFFLVLMHADLERRTVRANRPRLILIEVEFYSVKTCIRAYRHGIGSFHGDDLKSCSCSIGARRRRAIHKFDPRIGDMLIGRVSVVVRASDEEGECRKCCWPKINLPPQKCTHADVFNFYVTEA